MISRNFVRKVKNDEEGRKFIKEAKAFYKAHGFRVTLRGRHSDRMELYRQIGKNRTLTMDVPIRHAEEIGVYAYGNRYDEPPKFVEKVESWKSAMQR